MVCVYKSCIVKNMKFTLKFCFNYFSYVLCLDCLGKSHLSLETIPLGLIYIRFFCNSLYMYIYFKTTSLLPLWSYIYLSLCFSLFIHLAVYFVRFRQIEIAWFLLFIIKCDFCESLMLRFCIYIWNLLKYSKALYWYQKV